MTSNNNHIITCLIIYSSIILMKRHKTLLKMVSSTQTIWKSLDYDAIVYNESIYDLIGAEYATQFINKEIDYFI